MTPNVSVKEHIHTGEIREARLIGVVKPLREVDENKLVAVYPSELVSIHPTDDRMPVVEAIGGGVLLTGIKVLDFDAVQRLQVAFRVCAKSLLETNQGVSGFFTILRIPQVTVLFDRGTVLMQKVHCADRSCRFCRAQGIP